MDENSKISLKLQDLTKEQLIAFINSVIDSVTTSPYLAGVVPTADLETARDELVTALTDRDAKKSAAKSATELLLEKVLLAGDALRQVANDTEQVADGNATIQESGGFNTFIPGKAFPLGKLPAPESLVSRPGNNSGTVALNWSAVYGNKGYQVYITTNPLNNSWDKSSYASASQIVIEGLKTGTKYWFKVVALGSAGEGDDSDITDSVAR